MRTKEEREKDALRKIELRTEEINDVLSRPPRWIVRWGVTLLFSILVLIFVGSAFFRYPEVVSGAAEITAEHLPVQLVARTGGRLEWLAVKEKQPVMHDEILAVIESTASYEQVLQLKNYVDSLQKHWPVEDYSARYPMPLHLQVGELQSDYVRCLSALQDYRDFVQSAYYNRKMLVLQRQLVLQKALRDKSSNQEILMAEQLSIANELLRIDSVLHDQHALSVIDLSRSRSAWLSSLQQMDNFKSGIVNMDISLIQSDQMLADLAYQKEQQERQMRTSIRESVESLRSGIEQWEQKYVLRSPIDGMVTLTRFWQRYQNLQAGDVVLTVIPNVTAQLLGKVYLPSLRAGKVRVGQSVQIKLDPYPHMEYGMLRGMLRHISMVPVTINEEQVYIAEVTFPEGWTTSYGTRLEFGQQMQGIAEIITDDISLLQRLLNPLKSVLQKAK